ncbi:MAG: sulfatase-like hydrolase/transferase [Phycisphaerales bacterium]|nr:sulfatase-like hydrolase/transferase [Phycisphaerales bacterium]MBT7170745.1 sulfatase-like hydrolase/transferase [Phycisphaerales bacterium]
MKSTRRRFLSVAGLTAAGLTVGCKADSALAAPKAPKAPKLGKPNVIFILADDWGIGDVKCFGGDRCKIATPNMDALAKKGMMFMDAHSSSSVCTPTRYGVLTGRYNWRSRLKSGVLYGYDKHLIEVGDNRKTVANLMRDNGYTTACIGKWHLGMDMPKAAAGSKSMGGINWKGKIKNGPTAVGFDSYYGISASLDMPPYIWIKDDGFDGECTVTKAFHRRGPAHKDFFDYDVLPTIAKKSAEFVTAQAAAKKPFFLYMPLNAPHTPVSPSKAFKGKSGLGKYADFVMETDWAVGEVVKAVDAAGIAENTLIIVTADNGCSPAANKKGAGGSLGITFNGAKKDPVKPDAHYPCGIYRGHKADIYEGGHRVPFIAQWVGKVEAGSTCTDPTCLVDLYATCAEILDKKPDDFNAVDSVSMLPNLLGTATGPVREATVHHSINGAFSIRQGKWKLEFCPGSGGWSAPGPRFKGGLAGLPKQQLYDLSVDPGEQNNLYTKETEVVKTLTALMKQYVDQGRSTPGKPQKNNGPTNYLRGVSGAKPKKSAKKK